MSGSVEWKVNCGVPQVKLGPFLFLISINVLTDRITSMYKICADDTYPFSKVLNVNKYC